MKDGDSARTDENLGWRDTSESPDASFNVKERTNSTRAIESTPTKSRAGESSSSITKLDQPMITRVASAPPVVAPEPTRRSSKLIHYQPGGHADGYFNAEPDPEEFEDNENAYIGPPPPPLPTPPPAPHMVPPKYAEGGGSAADFFGTATPGSDVPITPGMEHKLSMSTKHDSYSSASVVLGSEFTSQPMYTGAITAEPISTPMGIPGAFPNDPPTPFGHQSQVSLQESFHTSHESNNIIPPAPPLSAPPMLHQESYGFGSAYASNINVPDTQDISPMHSSTAVDGIASSVALGTAAYLASSHGNGTYSVPPQPLYTPTSTFITTHQNEAPIRPGSAHESSYSIDSDLSSHYNTTYSTSTTTTYQPQTSTTHSNAGLAAAAAVGLGGAAAIHHHNQHQSQHGNTPTSNTSTTFVATPNQSSQYVAAVVNSNQNYPQSSTGYQTTTTNLITPSQAAYQSSQYQSSQHYSQQQSGHPSGSTVPLLASAAIGAGIGAVASHHSHSQSQSSNYTSNHPSYANQPPPSLHHTASINSINSVTSSSSITSSASSSSKLSSRPTKVGGILSMFGGGRKQSNAQQSHTSSGGKIAGAITAGTVTAAALAAGSSPQYGSSGHHKPTAGYGGYGSSSPISQHTSSKPHTHHAAVGTGLAIAGGRISSHHASGSHHASHSHSKPSVSFAGVTSATGAATGHATAVLSGKTSHNSLHSHHSHHTHHSQSSHSKPSSGLAAVTGASTSGLAGGMFSSGSTSQHQSSESNSAALLVSVGAVAVAGAAAVALATHKHKSHHNRPHLVSQASSSSTDSGRITSITGGRHNHNLDSSDIRGVHIPHILNAFDSASSSDFLFSSSTSSSESSSDSGSESDETRSKKRREKLERRQLKSDRRRHNRAQEAKRLKRAAETGAVIAGTAAVLSEYHSDDENKHRRRVERRKSSDSNLAFPHTGTGYSSDSSIYSTSANSNKGFFWGVKGKSKARRVASRESVGSSMGFGGDTTSPDSDSDGSGKPRKGKKRVSKKDSVDSNLAFGFGSYSTSRRSSYSSNLSSNLDSIRDEDEVDRRTSSSSRLSTERSRIVFPGHRTGTEEQHRADLEKIRLQEVAADIERQKRDAETISRAKLEKDRLDKESFDRDRAEREKQRLRFERERSERERFENERRVLYEEQTKKSKTVEMDVRMNQERERRMGNNVESGTRQVTPSFLRRISAKIR